MPRPTSLMTQYVDGQLASRELTQMMIDYTAQSHFDRDMRDDVDLYRDLKERQGVRSINGSEKHAQHDYE